MANKLTADYYTSRRAKWLAEFDAEDHAKGKGNHRFKRGRDVEHDWPPPWLRGSQRRPVRPLTLVVLPDTYAICRLNPDAALDPAWLQSCEFWSVTRSADELSLVLPEKGVPATWRAERGWRCFRVRGPLDFALTGVLAALAVPLADASISIFALSTYDTDYLLVRAADLQAAKRALVANGHTVLE